MGILEEINQLQNQGANQSQIISQLQERGYSNKQIQDAFGQAQIKNAVAGEETGIPAPSPDENQMGGGYSPSTQEIDYSQYPQESYSGESYQAPQQDYSGGSDVFIDIAEQVFNERIKKIQQQLESLNEFKVMGETKIDNLDTRLRKIEDIIDKLQISILNKVGSYGDTLNSIQKEMGMMQNSFSKALPGFKKPSTKSSSKKSSKKK